jgi:hypothetical protein
MTHGPDFCAKFQWLLNSDPDEDERSPKFREFWRQFSNDKALMAANDGFIDDIVDELVRRSNDGWQGRTDLSSFCQWLRICGKNQGFSADIFRCKMA